MLSSPKAIFNSIIKERLDFVFNSLSQFYHSVKNLTLIYKPKSFKNRAKITNGIINARNSLTFAYTNKFLSRSHNITCRCGTDNINIKIKKIEKKVLNTKVKVKLQEIVTVTINKVKIDLSIIACNR
jgi:hypothetical protein